jgi:hypothetical protein
MRVILLEWILEVVLSLRYSIFTVAACVQYIDRYLSVSNPIPISEYQLVGVTCLSLAAKIEQVEEPYNFKKMANLCDNAYKWTEIQKKELEILDKLQYKLHRPTIVVFAHYFQSISTSGGTSSLINVFIIYMSFHFEIMISHQALHLGLACSILTDFVERHKNKKTRWSIRMMQNCLKKKNKMHQISLGIARELVSYILDSKNEKIHNIVKKFVDKKMSENSVSEIRLILQNFH